MERFQIAYGSAHIMQLVSASIRTILGLAAFFASVVPVFDATADVLLTDNASKIPAMLNIFFNIISFS